ncbi:MAG: arginine--tRNA ligase [Candidatus Saccharibacteria bacterium]|nr:arginine--tRNA ligase [Candidatus Saccharibacteria bacterium]
MQEIQSELKNLIKNLYGLDFEPEVTPSPENIPADFSSNAPLKLAKELHNAPIEIAEELAEKATETENLKAFNLTVTAPGFLNFIASDEYLNTKIADLDQDFAKDISSDEYSGKTVICEFSDPNPFKVLHVGHLYTSIVGDSISKLYEYAGAKVIRANFGGDVGLHVAKTMYILMQKNPNELTIEDIAKCYVEGTAAYEEDEQAKQEITKLNKEIYKINSENLHDTALAKLYWQGRELSYAYFNDFYARIGLKFDKYYPESTVAGLGLKTVKEQLEKGVYELSDGAVIFDGEKYGLHTRVFINKEGVPTYEAKDVGLIFTKWNDYHFDKSIVITGNEQLEYMKVVLKSVEQYAKDLVEKTSHLTHGLVKLPGNVKMSSRKGNFLKAVDVLNLIDEALKSEYNSEDKTVALAATKYAFLKYKMGGNIVFDPNESVKMTGNSGPYLLYSAVRAKKILEKVGESSQDKNSAGELNDQERSLAKKILLYKDALNEALNEMAPHRLATYLYEVAQDFSRFYEACPVSGSEKTATRKKLVKVYLDVMTHGLNILGINTPEEM